MRVTTHNTSNGSAGSESVALLLPGMSLNATIFPALGLPCIAPNLGGIELGVDGITAELERDGLGVYVRLLEDELSRSKCWENSRRIVVGHSFGGMLALHWLLGDRGRTAPRVDGLVLIATTAGPMYERVKLRIPSPSASGLRMDFGWAVPIWNLTQITKAVKWFLCAGKLGADPVDFRELGVSSDRDVGIAGWRNTDWRAMRAFRYAMSGFDVRLRLGEITAPTIVLHGTDDSLFDLEDARLLAAKLPRSELRQIPGAGHALPITHGDAVVRAVGDLVRS